MNFFLICMTVSVVASASAMNVRFKDCGSALAKGIKISVDPCTADPCELKHGMNYSIGIDFTPGSASKNIHVSIHGIVAGLPVPFPFDHDDACKDSGLTCPLKPEVAVKYIATLPILSSYPGIKLYVKWELKDTDAKKDLVCIEIPVAIVDAGNNVHQQKEVRKLHWED